ncbi:MAG: polyprenyl synthetase family protein [Candidatus Korarchaeota archaeon]|nr:polyprenyl synthetase family protein [Candidatus Korarchaeota archaeon]
MPTTRIHVTLDEKTFHHYVENTRQLIESELSKLLSRVADLRLHGKIQYALLSRGKRLRPLMVLLSAQSVGGKREDIVPLALAIELLHNATLVHDDILDRDKFRRDIPAVHEKWSLNDAILVGDAMISLAINLTAEYGRNVLKIASETGLALCDGEYMDVSLNSVSMSEGEYLEKIRKKSASLFQTATRCGAIAGGGSELEIECLADFGENLGIAYQLSDDLLDITSSKDGIPKDLRRHRISLPLIHLYKSSNSAEREILLNNIQTSANENCVFGNRSFYGILQNLENKGSLDYCRKKINRFIARAITSLKPLRDTDFKAYLIRMTESLRQ